MNITRFSIKRPIGISMIFALIVVLGIFSFFRIENYYRKLIPPT